MQPCALALVLLLDASGSVGTQDWAAQVEGHAEAFEDGSIGRAIGNGPGVAVTAMAFSDQARVLLAWRVLHGQADAASFGAALRGVDRGPATGTDIGAALMAAIGALGTAPCASEQDVIDLVTDGEAAPEPALRARAYAAVQGIRINALGVGRDAAADWLAEHAVTPGGFVMQVEDWGSFAGAIRRKVTMEIAAR